jgi:hypothetical protein
MERVSAGEQHAQDILSETEQKAQASLTHAQQEANRIIAEARERAEHLVKTRLETAEKEAQNILAASKGTGPTAEPHKSPEASNLETAAPVQAKKKKGGSPGQPSQGHEDKQLDPGIYKGTIELAIPPPIGLERMLQLHKHLKQTPQVEVLNLGGSVDKGITIRLLLENPTPLLKVLEDLPEVKKVSDELSGTERTVPARQPGEEPPVKRILVITRE